MNKEKNEIINHLPDESRTVSYLEAITSFQKAVQKHLIKGHDYGQSFSGYNGKPTLLKSGAEKIIMLMGLRSTFNIDKEVEDHKAGYFFYRVKCQLIKNNEIITEGFGEANTEEDKYVLKPKSRRDGTVYYSPTKEDQRRYKFTVANTVLKMAKKRAMVDAVLIVASLSNIFTQDIEDIESYEDTKTIEAPKNQTQKQYNNKSSKNQSKKKIEDEKNKMLINNIKGLFQTMRHNKDLNKTKLNDKQYQNRLLCKLGVDKETGKEPESWKKLNSFRVKTWKDKLESGNQEMIERIKQAMTELFEEDAMMTDDKVIQEAMGDRT